MCLVAAMSRVHPEAGLVLAANRDELFARPSGPMQVLSPGPPRILGGRDLLVDGTWLAINEHGVLAALTNQPLASKLPPGTRDMTKRSRGELPLLLARHASAAAAVEAFAKTTRPDDYNPCALLVGDARSLFYVAMLRGAHPEVEELTPGVHVLENRELRDASAKQRYVRERLVELGGVTGAALLEGIEAILSSTEVPPDTERLRAESDPRPRAVEAARVIAGPYGTRSSTIALVTDGVRPRVLFTNEPPGTSRFEDAAAMWGA